MILYKHSSFKYSFLKLNIMKIFDFIFISFCIITTGVFFGVFIFHLIKGDAADSAIFGAGFIIELLYSIEYIIDNRKNKQN